MAAARRDTFYYFFHLVRGLEPQSPNLSVAKTLTIPCVSASRLKQVKKYNKSNKTGLQILCNALGVGGGLSRGKDGWMVSEPRPREKDGWMTPPT